jgi:type I restriction enzyme S subunit
MKTVRLGEVCQQYRQSVKPGTRDDLPYIGLESIESGTGQFVKGSLSKTPEAPQANSFRFGPEHILYGKLRPYLNKVALPDFPGKCSTEIIPLLPSQEVDRAYLAYFLRSQRVVDLISARTAGARMPRAEMEFVFSLPMHLPPLSEQRRIVDLLSRAEGILRLRQEAEKKAAELIPALFIDMFGDPATNPKGWPVGTIGDVIESAEYGSSTKASSDGDGLPMIRMGNVDYAGNLDLSDLKHVELSDLEINKYRLQAGDILFNRTNSKELVGKTGIWDGSREAVAASYFIRVRVNRKSLNPFYLWAFMNSAHMKRVLFDTARGAIGQANINARELRGFQVPIPPLATQEEFERHCQNIAGLKDQQTVATSKANATFDVLLARTFIN